MSLSLDLREWIAKAQGNAEQVVRAASVELFAAVVMRSPVGSPDLWQSPPPPGYVGGRFRGNWQVSLGSPSTAVLNTIDKTGAATIAAGEGVISSYDSSIPRIWFSNNLPYAYRLEYESWSSQAPAGMVRVSIAEFQSIVDEKVRELT